MNKTFIVLILGLAAFAAGGVFAIANPAATYCQNMGYTLSGENCVFGDGNQCEEWAFFRGECGQSYVKDLGCAEIGETSEPGRECCSGLTAIQNSTPGSDGKCITAVGGWPVCRLCGNGVCDEGENICNCPQDCGNETQFCIGEGKIGHAIPPPPQVCCSGLTQISNARPETGAGSCIAPNDGSFICSKCGDKICGGGENSCNCPADCRTSSSPVENLPYCGNGICNNMTCMAIGCPSAETAQNCPQDCGRNEEAVLKDVKIMPSTASETAIQKLGEVKNVQVELKEAGQASSESQNPVYEVKMEKPVKIFGLFPVTAKLTTQVDAETGNIILVKKPWWMFFAW